MFGSLFDVVQGATEAASLRLNAGVSPEPTTAKGAANKATSSGKTDQPAVPDAVGPTPYPSTVPVPAGTATATATATAPPPAAAKTRVANFTSSLWGRAAAAVTEVGPGPQQRRVIHLVIRLGVDHVLTTCRLARRLADRLCATCDL